MKQQRQEGYKNQPRAERHNCPPTAVAPPSGQAGYPRAAASGPRRVATWHSVVWVRPNGSKVSTSIRQWPRCGCATRTPCAPIPAPVFRLALTTGTRKVPALPGQPPRTVGMVGGRAGLWSGFWLHALGWWPAAQPYNPLDHRNATACTSALDPQPKKPGNLGGCRPGPPHEDDRKKTSPSHAVPMPRIKSHSRRDTSERHMQATCMISADRLPK